MEPLKQGVDVYIMPNAVTQLSPKILFQIRGLFSFAFGLHTEPLKLGAGT
jgi:hypothetical protein